MRTRSRQDAESRPLRAQAGQILREAANWGELRKSPYGIAPLAILAAIFFFQTFDNRTFVVAGPEIARDLRLELTKILGIMAIVGAVGIFAAIYGGYVADRHRRTPFVAVGAVISGIASIFTGRAQALGSLGTARVIDDAGSIATGVPIFSLLADYYPPELRGRVFAVLGVILRVAGLIALGTIGFLVVTIGWRATFLATGLPLIVMGVVALVALREPIRGYFERKQLGAEEEIAKQEQEPPSFGEAWRTTWSVRTLRRLFVGDIWSGAGETIFATLFVFFLADRYGLDALARSLISYPAVVAGLIGGFLGGGLIDTFTRRNPSMVLRVIALFGLISAFGNGFLALGPPLVFLIALRAVAAFGGSLIGPAFASVYSQVIPPNIRTQGLKITALASLPGLIIFLPLAGVIHDQYGFTPAMLFGVPFMVMGAAIQVSAAGFFDRDRRAAAAAAAASEEWRRTKKEGGDKLLVSRSVDVEYDGIQVLFGVDFDVEEGEIIALLGTNGAGKSTLLKAISGVQEASGGGIVYDGRDITHMPPHEITLRGITLMPGGRGIFPGLTVRENLMLSTWSADDERGHTSLDEIYELFPVLRRRAGELAGNLSGGEQQMVSLAQAFARRPKLLMIDELSLGLSPAVVAELVEVVKKIHALGTTVIVVEQSVNVALTLAERAIFMEKGEVKFFGETAELLRRPDILRAVYVKGTGAMVESVTTPLSESETRQRAFELERSPIALEARGITKSFGGVRALNDVSFELREGEVLGVIGPNGSGKTTLFDVIGGYQLPDAGVVLFEGGDITHLRAYERARRRMVRRFQDARQFQSLTVFENLLVALDQRMDVRSAWLAGLSVPRYRKAERRIATRAERLLELLELGDFRDKFIRELSTGVRRLVDIASVLATNPKVLLLDEPSTGIAQAEAEMLAPLLRRVRFETGCSMLVIEHDMTLISSLADELIVLDAGNYVTRGVPEDVLNDERVIEAYLGTSEEVIRRSGALPT